MPEPDNQPPAIDLSFLDAAIEHVDGDCYEPLTPEEVAALLDEARRTAAYYVVRVSRIQVRLGHAIEGITSPYPAQWAVADRKAALDQLFVDRYWEGAVPDLVAELCRLMGGDTATEQAKADDHGHPREGG